MDLQRAVYREVVTSSIRKRNTHHKRKIFDHFKVILDKSHHANKTALRHQFHRFAGKCFYAWSDWTYSVGSGLERQRWPGPRKYEVRYNQKLVNHFIKMRLKKMAFKPWKRFSRTQATVNLMFAQKLTTFIRETFTAWKVLTKHHHVLRKEALTMWMGTYKVGVYIQNTMAWSCKHIHSLILYLLFPSRMTTFIICFLNFRLCTGPGFRAFYSLERPISLHCAAPKPAKSSSERICAVEAKTEAYTHFTGEVYILCGHK